MSVSRRVFVAVVIAFSFSSIASADPSTHRKAAEELMDALQMRSVMEKTLDKMIEMQAQANPAMAPYKAVMTRFFRKHMGWDAIKNEYVALYVETFTEPEIRELIAFYRTKTGKKAAAKVPELMAKGAEIGTRRVQEHMPELLKALQDAQAQQR